MIIKDMRGKGYKCSDVVWPLLVSDLITRAMTGINLPYFFDLIFINGDVI